MMIPEASLNKVFEGMPAKVRVDAFPGRVFPGTLTRIGLLPDAATAQLNPGLKLYKCEVECNFREIVVRPGMSCDVELIAEVHEDARYLPVQCVVRVNDQPRVYVQEGEGFLPRSVEIGLDNNTMIHILSGVEKGDVVMLAPPLVQDEEAETELQQMPQGVEELPPGARRDADRRSETGAPDELPEPPMSAAESGAAGGGSGGKGRGAAAEDGSKRRQTLPQGGRPRAAGKLQEGQPR
jgi:HlyD family secretion protein